MKKKINFEKTFEARHNVYYVFKILVIIRYQNSCAYHDLGHICRFLRFVLMMSERMRVQLRLVRNACIADPLVWARIYMRMHATTGPLSSPNKSFASGKTKYFIAEKNKIET